ncbi:hypothetical protein ACND5I_003100 [Escherichia coli]
MTAKMLASSQMAGMGWIACKKPQIKPVSNMESPKLYISIVRTLTLILRPVRVFRIPSGNVSLKHEQLEHSSQKPGRKE